MKNYEIKFSMKDDNFNQRKFNCKYNDVKLTIDFYISHFIYNEITRRKASGSSSRSLRVGYRVGGRVGEGVG